MNGQEVAPLAGAWIEMSYSFAVKPRRKSLPSRERGLKLGVAIAQLDKEPSLPSRERGLKLNSLYMQTAKTGRSPRGSVD